jgi:branched-chain amino acid transport system ATP-binding protein
VPTGLARLVEVARALATRPSVLLLDEPSSGLDRGETAALGHVLGRLASDGMAVLLVEHDLSLVMGICGHLTVLDYGQVIAMGDPPTVKADPAVQEAYLGTTSSGPSTATGREGMSAAPTNGSPTDGSPTNGSTTNGASAATLRPTTQGDAAPTDPMAPLIELADVHVAYGKIEVVHGVSLQIPSGAVCALLGPNGAGKSTLMKVLSGQLKPSAGRAVMDGETLGTISSDQLARRGICSIPEGRGVFPNLTVAENLRMSTYRSASIVLSALEAHAYERFPKLRDRRRQLAGTLSGGEQQMLALARALCTDPKVLLLDEISMGLAPVVVEELYALVGELARSETLTVVLVEQFAEAALALATQAAVMVNGKIVQAGAPGVIEAGLVESYMGGVSA